MTYSPTFRTCAVVLGLLLTAGSASATTDPTTKRPTTKRARPAAAMVKAPAATAPTKATKRPPQMPLAAAVPRVAPLAATSASNLPTSPQVVQLKGIVQYPDGQPCAGASVYPAGAPRQLVVTDAQGAFVLPVPASGTVALRVDYFGVGSSRVEVPTPSTETLRITLGK